MTRTTNTVSDNPTTTGPLAMAAPTCVTCGATLQGRYCHACGERVLQPNEFRLLAFLARSANAVFDLDSRLYRSFRTLLVRPGLLTAEYMAGRRRQYLNPVQVFLIANLVFFAALTIGGGVGAFTTELRSHTDQLGYSGIASEMIARQGAEGSAERAAFERRFNQAVPRYANSMVIVLAPLFAGIFSLLLIGRRHPFVHHLVFSLHFLAFMLLTMLVYPPVLRLIVALIPALAPLLQDLGFSLTLLALLGTYLFWAARAGYGVGKGRAIFVSLGLCVLELPAIVLYRMLLFFTVYFSVR